MCVCACPLSSRDRCQYPPPEARQQLLQFLPPALQGQQPSVCAVTSGAACTSHLPHMLLLLLQTLGFKTMSLLELPHLEPAGSAVVRGYVTARHNSVLERCAAAEAELAELKALVSQVSLCVCCHKMLLTAASSAAQLKEWMCCQQLCVSDAAQTVHSRCAQMRDCAVLSLSASRRWGWCHRGTCASTEPSLLLLLPAGAPALPKPAAAGLKGPPHQQGRGPGMSLNTPRSTVQGL